MVCSLHFQVWSLCFFTLKRSGLLHHLAGVNDGRVCNKYFLISTIESFVEKVKQCKSSEEKEKTIADVKANTNRLNEVGVALIHVPI